MKQNMEVVKRKSINDKLSKYDYLCSQNSGDYIEVTEWANGEGITVNINSDKTFDLSYGELDAINYLSKTIQYDVD